MAKKIKEYWTDKYSFDRFHLSDKKLIEPVKHLFVRVYLASDVDKALMGAVEKTHKLEHRFHHDSQLSYGEIFDCFFDILEKHMGDINDD